MYWCSVLVPNILWVEFKFMSNPFRYIFDIVNSSVYSSLLYFFSSFCDCSADEWHGSQCVRHSLIFDSTELYPSVWQEHILISNSSWFIRLTVYTKYVQYSPSYRKLSLTSWNGRLYTLWYNPLTSLWQLVWWIWFEFSTVEIFASQCSYQFRWQYSTVDHGNRECLNNGLVWWSEHQSVGRRCFLY
jgi:hypothetical protein